MMYKSTGMENDPLLEQEDPLAESMQDDGASDDLFIGKGDKKLSINDIRKKVAEWSQKIDISDITKPDCENTVLHTRSICTAYIVFVIISLIGLVGIFLWRYFRKTIKNKKESKKKNDLTEEA